MMPVWSDNSSIGIRFNQTGYSSPTIFPEACNYNSLELFAIDLAKAQTRNESHLDWAWEEYAEARQDYLEEQQEVKDIREERGY